MRSGRRRIRDLLFFFFFFVFLVLARRQSIIFLKIKKNRAPTDIGWDAVFFEFGRELWGMLCLIMPKLAIWHERMATPEFSFEFFIFRQGQKPACQLHVSFHILFICLHVPSTAPLSGQLLLSIFNGFISLSNIAKSSNLPFVFWGGGV